MSGQVFLLGAGFNRDAKRYVGPVMAQPHYGEESEVDCDYPLVGELARKCFTRELGETESIEELFASAVRMRNFEPLERLYNLLMEADYYIAPRLLAASNMPNPYAQFFVRFKGHFLTFNYDSLPEILLLKLGAWSPLDGYGLPVLALTTTPSAARKARQPSLSPVLHLHGSLCVYTSLFDLEPDPDDHMIWLSPLEKPNYMFDPYSLAHIFSPFRGMPRQIAGYEPLEDRVIAPVPDKAEGLKRDFIVAIHDLAKRLLESSSALVVIGYRFHEPDRLSYDSLLRAFSHSEHPQALLVSPDAAELRDRLARSYPRIHWDVFATTFADWANAEFPMV